MKTLKAFKEKINFSKKVGIARVFNNFFFCLLLRYLLCSVSFKIIINNLTIDYGKRTLLLEPENNYVNNVYFTFTFS